MCAHIPAAKRIERARALLQEARDLPEPAIGGRSDFNYILQVKALLKEARELVQLIPKRVGVTEELKAQVAEIFREAEQVHEEKLKWTAGG